MTQDAESVEIVVLRDGEGHYFLLPRPALERGRVADADQAALEEVLGGGDVAGFVAPGIGGLTLIGQVQAQPVGGALQIVSPRDAASGQATGKRQHKPFVFTTQYD